MTSARTLRPDRRPMRRRRSLLMRLLRGVLLGFVLALLFIVSLAFALRAQGAGDDPVLALEGAFFGLGSAAGMRVRIEAGAEPSGAFIDSNGVEAPIAGGWREGGLETLLNFPGRPVFARFDPAALGLQLTVLPLDPEGRPLRDQARVLAFLREGTPMPAQPGLYHPPPARDDGESDADVFLVSYQFWPPEGVANGFSQIGARYRTMIRMFPQLHADVLWKLCEAGSPRARELTAEALRGQGATCADIVETLDRLQRTGRFLEWKNAVAAEIDALMPSVQCARGYIVREDVCTPAARRVAEAAVSMETLGTLLAAWR